MMKSFSCKPFPYITTFVAGLRQHGVTAPLVLDGPMTGAAFRAYCFMPNTRLSLRGDEAERNSGKAVDTAVLDSAPRTERTRARDKTGKFASGDRNWAPETAIP